MPCNCEGYEQDDERRSVKKLHRLTRVACDMRFVIRRYALEDELSVATRRWISEHDAWDAKRIAVESARGERDAARKLALDKLTMDDRRVLGL